MTGDTLMEYNGNEEHEEHEEHMIIRIQEYQGGMYMGQVFVQWELISSFVEDAFASYGIPREDAKICRDVLLASDEKGIDSMV